MIVTNKKLLLGGASVIYVAPIARAIPTYTNYSDGSCLGVVGVNVGNPLFPIEIKEANAEIGNESSNQVADFIMASSRSVLCARKIGGDSNSKTVIVKMVTVASVTAPQQELGSNVNVYGTTNSYIYFDESTAQNGLDLLITATVTEQITTEIAYDLLTRRMAITIIDKEQQPLYSVVGSIDSSEIDYIGMITDRRIAQIRINPNDAIYNASFDTSKTWAKNDIVTDSGTINIEHTKKVLKSIAYKCDYSATFGEDDNEIIKALYEVSQDAIIQTVIDVKANTYIEAVQKKDSLGIETDGAIFLLNIDTMLVRGRPLRYGFSGDFVGQNTKRNYSMIKGAIQERTRAIVGTSFPIVNRGIYDPLIIEDDNLIMLVNNRITPIVATRGIICYGDMLGSSKEDNELKVFQSVDIEYFIRRMLAIILEKQKGQGKIIGKANAKRDGERLILDANRMNYFNNVQLEVGESESGSLYFSLSNCPDGIFRVGEVFTQITERKA